MSEPHTHSDGLLDAVSGGASALLNSGHIVVVLFTFVLTLAVVVIVVLYRDGKQSDRFLREIQLKMLETIQTLTRAVEEDNRGHKTVSNKLDDNSELLKDLARKLQ